MSTQLMLAHRIYKYFRSFYKVTSILLKIQHFQMESSPVMLQISIFTPKCTSLQLISAAAFGIKIVPKKWDCLHSSSIRFSNSYVRQPGLEVI